MTPIAGYIQVTFTPNYLGDHRVCYRIQGSGDPYDCITIGCNSVDPCTAYLTPVSFENEACDEVVYEGYVQASCEDPETLDGAVFWEHTITPNPDCRPYLLTCLGVENDGGLSLTIDGRGNSNFIPRTVSAFIECYCANPVAINNDILLAPIAIGDTTLIAPGSIYCGIWNGFQKAEKCGGDRGYNPCDPNDNPALSGPPCDLSNPCYPMYCECIYKPVISIGPPPAGGIQATAEVIMGYGALINANSLTIINNGTGIPSLSFTYSGVLNTNLPIAIPGSPMGYGKQRFNVTVQSGNVVSVVPLASPAGYYFVENEQFSFDPADIGGVTGVVCQVKPNGTDFGMITGIVVTNPGSGYIIPPPISLLTPPCNIPSSQEISIISSVGVVQGPCPAFFPGEGCGTFQDPTPPIIPSLPIGSSFQLCYPSRAAIPSPTIPDSYELTLPETCCYDCLALTVLAGVEPNPTITYTDCNLQNVVVVTMSSLSLSLPCVVAGSWVSTDPTTIFLESGNCTS